MRRTPIVVLVVLAALAAAPAAQAGVFQQIFSDFKPDQHISACRWSTDQLNKAKSEIPPDIEQYAPNFVDELNRAIQDHALGACEPRVKPAPVIPPPPPPPVDRGPRLVDPGPAQSPPPAAQPDPSLTATPVPNLSADRSIPPVLVILILILGAAALAAAAVAVSWWRGWDLGAPFRGLGQAVRGLYPF